MPAGRSLGAAGRTWYVLVVTVIMAAVCPQDYALGQVDRAKALEHYAEGGLHDARNDPTNAIKSYLQALVAHTGGDIGRVCETARLSRSQVYRLLKKHGIVRRF